MRIQTTKIILTLTLLACWTVSARAETIVGTFTGDATLTPTGTPGISTQSFSGDGSDTKYGAFTVTSTSTVDLSNPPSIVISDGMITETFSNGTLFGTSSGDGKADGHGKATFSIDFAITGGTGIFTGAQGNVTITGTINSTSPTTATTTASYSGTLSSVPEPSTFALLIPGCLGLSFTAFRRRRSGGI